MRNAHLAAAAPLSRRGFVALMASAPLLARAQAVQLARGGSPLLQVITAPTASQRVQDAATQLADYLGRITGARFGVATGDGSQGIVVGIPREFPALGMQSHWAAVSAAEREDYLIESRSAGVLLLGATEAGVEHAVWDFLHHLGYRQFFPGDHWEVVPAQRELSVQLNKTASPSYRARTIWYGYGPWDYAAEPFRRWKLRNRMGAGTELRSGHAYSAIIAALKEDFDRHPEFYPLMDGKRQPSHGKICLGNAQLRALIVSYELAQFRADPALDSVSLEPSDGGGWCECPLCRGVGSISDRVVLLANEVAVAVTREFPGKLVGMYAYGDHSPPPAIRVHPNVVVSIATAFVRGGFTVDELMEGWARQGAPLGVREYYAVNVWDRDQPGRARGGNVAYLARTIPAFHAKGARFMSAESGDSWGPNGLGYYFASRVLWDVREADTLPAVKEDFLTRAFGAAREPMREFYRQVDGSIPNPLLQQQIAAMARALLAARRVAGADASLQGRLDDLALYTRYCALFQRYSVARGAARQSAFEGLIRHTYRMRTTMMVHAKALHRDLPKRDKAVSIPDEARWNVPEGRNPWKSSVPFTPEEIAAFLEEAAGMQAKTQAAYPAASFSGRLLPAAPLHLPMGETGAIGAGRGTQSWLVYVAQAPASIELKVTGGLVTHYRNRGNVRITLAWVEDAAAPPESGKQVAEDRSTPPDGEEHDVRLAVPRPGLYRLTVNDGNDQTLVKLPPRMPAVEMASEQTPMNAHRKHWTAWFYVPRGTRTIAFVGGERGQLQDSHGRTQLSLNGLETGVHLVTVPAGEDGTAWRVHDGFKGVRLLNVPPYLAAGPSQLLVPEEVLNRDR